MSLTFTQNSGYLSLPASTDFALPDANWYVGFWCRMSSTPVMDQYLYAVGAGARGTHTIFYNSAGPRFVFFARDDNGGVANNIATNSTYPADGKNRLVVFQNEESLSRVVFYICEQGASAVLDRAASDPTNILGEITPPLSLNIGRRDDGAANRTLSGGSMGHFFMGSGLLSISDITAMGNGLSPLAFVNRGLQFYLPMTSASTQKDVIGQNVASVNGTVSLQESFPATFFQNEATTQASTVTGGGTIPPLYYSLDRRRRA